MNNTPVPIQIGSFLIADLMNPHHSEMDLDAIDANLKTCRRFSNHPQALTVWQHKKLVVRLVDLDRENSFVEGPDGDELHGRVRQWAEHHDDHEGVIGDIVAPVKTLIGQETDVLQKIEEGLDRVICTARMIPYPSEVVRGLVHRYDKAAETLEWRFALKKPMEHFNHPCPEYLMRSGAALISWARRQ